MARAIGLSRHRAATQRQAARVFPLPHGAISSALAGTRAGSAHASWNSFQEKGLPSRQFLTPNAYPTFDSYWQKGYWGYLAIPQATTTTTTTTVTTTKVPVATKPATVPQARGIH